ncbi:hypothetical protein BC567DRAFT_226519, partial [Phyllosticta citribraziliensis]
MQEPTASTPHADAAISNLHLTTSWPQHAYILDRSSHLSSLPTCLVRFTFQLSSRGRCSRWLHTAEAQHGNGLVFRGAATSRCCRWRSCLFGSVWPPHHHLIITIVASAFSVCWLIGRIRKPTPSSGEQHSFHRVKQMSTRKNPHHHTNQPREDAIPEV